MPAEKPYLSLEEVAEVLGVTYQLIYRLVRAGEMPAVRLGKLYRISREDLDHYLDSNKQGGMSSGGTCSVCGKTYSSRLSLKQCCTEENCTSPICTDCWTRGKQRFCKTHLPKKIS